MSGRALDELVDRHGLEEERFLGVRFLARTSGQILEVLVEIFLDLLRWFSLSACAQRCPSKVVVALVAFLVADVPKS
jgi:hypothetical protein